MHQTYSWVLASCGMQHSVYRSVDLQVYRSVSLCHIPRREYSHVCTSPAHIRCASRTLPAFYADIVYGCSHRHWCYWLAEQPVRHSMAYGFNGGQLRIGLWRPRLAAGSTTQHHRRACHIHPGRTDYFAYPGQFVVGLRIGRRPGSGCHATNPYPACPGGANPIVVLMTGAPWSFVFTPVLAGSIVIGMIAWCLNNARSQGSYPKYWW